MILDVALLAVLLLIVILSGLSGLLRRRRLSGRGGVARTQEAMEAMARATSRATASGGGKRRGRFSGGARAA